MRKDYRLYLQHRFRCRAPPSSMCELHSLIMSADRMKHRDKKPQSKRGVNMPFSELVKRIVQRDTNGAQQQLDEELKWKRATSNRRKKSRSPG
jgi:hypothetical protein